MANEVVKKAIDMELIKNSEEDDLFYFVDQNTLLSERITAPKYSYWKSVLRVFFKKKINWFILFAIFVLFVCVIILPFFFSYDKFGNILDLEAKMLKPNEAMAHFNGNFAYILGTGIYGEPIFSGLWTSARISIALAVVCAIINMALGIIVGALWGYSKKLDLILNAVYNIIANVPYILLVSVVMFIAGSGFGPFILALTITGWIGIAYFFRTQVLIIRDREYNLASRCLGTNMFKVVTRNVLPFLISVIVTILATELPGYISMEVYLTYLGIGLGADTPSLGAMISDFQGIFTTAPWGFWPPVAVAAAITITLYVLGQNLADASDPRTHMQ